MIRQESRLRVVLIVAILLLAASRSTEAQATRTWISAFGNDFNDCSYTMPCRSLVGALAKTAAGGEIDFLDPVEIGPNNIGSSITIDGRGVFVGIEATGIDGFKINAGPSDVVVLRGLSFVGRGTGTSGIKFNSGKALYIEDCTIDGFGIYGVDFEPSGASELFVQDSTIRNNGVGSTGGGIFIKGTSPGVKASVDKVRLERNVFGVKVMDLASAAVSNSVSSDNGFSGFTAVSSSSSPSLAIESSVSTHNGTTGVASAGPFAIVRLSNVTVIGNQTGLATSSGGSIISFGNNRIGGNTVNGAPTLTVPQQ